MPKKIEAKKLIVHELSAEHQKQITDYLKNFQKKNPSLLKEHEWREILKQSTKCATEIFNDLNKINNDLEILFIRDFPIEALTQGYETYKIIGNVMLENRKDINDIIMIEIKPKFLKLWDKKLKENLEYIMTKIDSFTIIQKFPLSVSNALIDYCRTAVKEYYNYFYKTKGKEYCFIVSDVIQPKKIIDFQWFSLKLQLYINVQNDDSKPLTVAISTLMKKYWEEVIKQISTQNIPTYVTQDIKSDLLVLIKIIEKKDKEFREEIDKFLKPYLLEFKKQFNFYASNDSQKIYPFHFPKINFFGLWYKRIIIDFYYQNQEFLDNHLKEKEQLLRLNNCSSGKFYQYCENIRSKTNKYSSFWKKLIPSYWLSKSTGYDLYYEKLQIIGTHIEEKKPIDYHTTSFQKNYVHNKMLDSLITDLEDSNTKINRKNLVSDKPQVESAPKLDAVSNKKLEEEIEKIEDSSTTVKPKIKTRKKADYSKITKKTKWHIKSRNEDNADKKNSSQEKQPLIVTKAKKDCTQQNIEQVAVSLQQIKSSEINQIINNLIKILKNNEKINNEQNHQISAYLQIVDKIHQAKQTDNNNKIIEQIYNICSKKFNIVRIIDNQEITTQLFSLVEQLETTTTINTKKEPIHYYDYQRALPSIILEAESSSSNSELDAQLISHSNFLSLTRKFEEYMVYNLNRGQELDHENGRPAIYLGFNEKNNQHELIFGTSKVKKKRNEVLNLKISTRTQTYWYYENIINIDITNNEFIGDYWFREKNNKPIDFLSNEAKEELKYNIDAMKNPTGMQQYFKDYENTTKAEDEKNLEFQKQEKKQQISFNNF